MKKMQGRWSDVRAEDYVADREGELWRVDRWDHVAANLTNKTGETKTIRPDALGRVVFYRRTMKDAVALVEQKLGGVMIEEIRTDQ